MLIKKSPGGSTFPYYYKGGEIHALKYGSYFNKEEDLLTLMKEEEIFIKQSNKRLPMWIDLYETNLTDRVLTGLISNIDRLENHIVKLAFVGCSFRDKRRLASLSKKLDAYIMPHRYFKDPEDAKTWLVSEKY